VSHRPGPITTKAATRGRLTHGHASLVRLV